MKGEDKRTHYLVRVQAQARRGTIASEGVSFGIGTFNYDSGHFHGCHKCPDGTYCCDPMTGHGDDDCCTGEALASSFLMDLVYLLDEDLVVLHQFRIPRSNGDRGLGPLDILRDQTRADVERLVQQLRSEEHRGRPQSWA